MFRQLLFSSVTERASEDRNLPSEVPPKVAVLLPQLPVLLRFPMAMENLRVKGETKCIKCEGSH